MMCRLMCVRLVGVAVAVVALYGMLSAACDDTEKTLASCVTGTYTPDCVTVKDDKGNGDCSSLTPSMRVPEDGFYGTLTHYGWEAVTGLSSNSAKCYTDYPCVVLNNVCVKGSPGVAQNKVQLVDRQCPPDPGPNRRPSPKGATPDAVKTDAAVPRR